MKHTHLDGQVGSATEKRFQTFTCMGIKEKYGSNEINLYLDDITNKGTTEMFVDSLQSLRVEVLDDPNPAEEITKLYVTHKNGNVTFIYLDCPFDTLLAAVAAEQMAIRATQEDQNLP